MRRLSVLASALLLAPAGLLILLISVIGGSAAPPAMIETFDKDYGVEVLHAWGMSEMSRSTIVIEAPMSQVSEVLFDLEKYPDWSDSITKVKVTERDEGGRVTGATLTIAAGAVKDEVSLSYNWDGAPERLEFELEDANMLTKMDGAYILKDLGDETEVTYELSVGLSMPIPQMMITKQEKTTIDQALAQLKEHCEG